MAASTSSTRAAELPAANGAERADIERALERLCDRHAAELGSVADAVRYSLLGGGKRLRGRLVLSAYHAAGGTADCSALAAAIEVVHAYSLIHDDLPCMDDDDMRRGRPTVHRVYGVRVATAAGVVMVPLAVRGADDAARELGLPPDVRGRIVSVLMRASGAGGMIGGQLMDLDGEDRSLNLVELEQVHRAKTGALIAASVSLGGLAAGASEPRLVALERFGQAIGLAFQIADDVLDVTETTDTLGKPAGRDLDLRKSTYPAVLGVEGATSRAQGLVDDACSTLQDAGLLSPALNALARFVVERRS